MINQKLRQELLHMMKTDQVMRNAIQKGETYKPEIDAKNTARLKQIIKKHGWPTFSLVGNDGAMAAWLLAQHADKTLGFQKKCLGLLSKAVAQGQGNLGNLAYLTDRVLVHQGKKQVYGTQFYQNKKGKYGPRPIAKPNNIEKLRKTVGLEPFWEYEKQMRQLQAKSAKS